MNTYKKIIFLSNKEKHTNNLAVLSIEKKHNGVLGEIKSYGNLQGDYLLGIQNKDKIIKQNIKFSSNTYNFVLPADINLDNTLGCVLCECTDEFKPILWGSEKSDNYKAQIVSNLKNNLNKLSSIQSNKTTIPCQTHTPQEKEKVKNNQDAIPASQPYNNINHIFEENMNISNSGFAISPSRENTNTNYLKEQYSQISMDNIDFNQEIAVASASNLFESDEDEINNTIDNELNKYSSHEFYDMIAEQLDDLFSKYPPEPNLEKLIEGSKWCKINTDVDNKYHVVGIIYKNDDIKYICYGVPGSYDIDPPREMQGYAQWLPTNVTNPYTEGYWVMYQDADTGENIYLN